MKSDHEFLSHIQNEYDKLYKSNSAPEWLTKVRARGIASLHQSGLPTNLDEEWRFFNFPSIYGNEFSIPDGTLGVTVTKAEIEKYTLKNTDAYLLVFLNGRFRKDLSDVETDEKNFKFCTLSSLSTAGRLPFDNLLVKHIGLENNPFTELNSALLTDGAYLAIPDDMRLAKPVHILHLTTGSEKLAVSPRNIIAIGENCHATILESYVGDCADYFSNSVTEIVVGESSIANHYKLQKESDSAVHVGTVYAYQHKGSQFTSCTIAVGSKVNRNNVHVFLSDENIECTLNGLYLGNGKQLIDNRTRIDHAKPNCRSWEVFKGILDDNSSGVFNGKIYVHQDAQKTDAKQTNRVLLLSDDAKINTKPELEIFADDVKCTHGATVGQLDGEAMFYLRSRGIDYKSAYAILTKAFAADVIDTISIKSLKEEVYALLG